MNLRNLELEEKIILVVVGVVGLCIIILLIQKVFKRQKRDYFLISWKALQARCADKTQWATAIFEADDLLDKALQKKKVKGKTMGERLVSAQNIFTDNDGAWYGHKLRMKLEEKPGTALKKQDVKKALLGLGQALRDLGVMK